MQPKTAKKFWKAFVIFVALAMIVSMVLPFVSL
jgi:hypothetical protein